MGREGSAKEYMRKCYNNAAPWGGAPSVFMMQWGMGCKYSRITSPMTEEGDRKKSL